MNLSPCFPCFPQDPLHLSFLFFRHNFNEIIRKKNKNACNKNISNGSSNNGSSPENFVIYFKDLKQSKRKVYKELKNKSGVYLFINDVTNDLYVGSSINLSKRMVSHFYYANSEKIGTTILIRAMKRYGLNNFSLGILEFCERDAIKCVKLEQK